MRARDQHTHTHCPVERKSDGFKFVLVVRCWPNWAHFCAVSFVYSLWISRLLVFNVVAVCRWFCSFSCILSPLDSLLCDLVNVPRVTKPGVCAIVSLYTQFIYFMSCNRNRFVWQSHGNRIITMIFITLPQYLFIALLFSHPDWYCKVSLFFCCFDIHILRRPVLASCFQIMM